MNDLEKFAQRYPLTSLFFITLALIGGIYFGAMTLLPHLRH